MLWRLLAEVGATLVVGDFLIYWCHRAMHAFPYLRNHVHSVHHSYSTPFSWAGGWVHPFESFCVVMAQLIPALFVFRIHLLSLFVFTIIWVTLLVEEHSGHDVWWSPLRVLQSAWPIPGGGALHDIHHYKPSKNYAFVFGGWDFLFGTYEEPGPKNVNPFVEPWTFERKERQT